ncbi:amidase [Albimonas pacifica]|uniref:Aspartyl-tRNA(Asn)/glutamyl-tRNA(Gln) amidotransferase subunit A n=1 Tax=Albimonas pacifica TaxID=1114924 RepID=A0A1I3EMB1_9RHOB|nr:amidase [Albimonas pacifica]SFI00099.1 aspartyl-tRNA(Asn)/glutamyl-tRNA(Gln) amidotransferase subunit A [Albimonas pacifica]
MSLDALRRHSAVALREMLIAREISAVELMQAVLGAAERLQPSHNCFITLAPEAAMEGARAADAALSAGETPGLLHGLPCGVKDIVNTAGMRTTFGSLLQAGNVPTQDAVAAARLRAAGAVIFGKTTTPEYGAKCLTDAPLFGRTPNAWSLEHSSGGSSGGSAVATALGIGPISVATDGGGSTRIPAACNGVVGLKQSLGAIPHSQVPDAFGNYTYVTPMTRDVASTALMMQAMGGAHPSDPWSVGAPVPDYPAAARPEGDLAGKRILFCPAPPGKPISAAMQAAFDASLTRLADLGAELEPFDGEGLDVEPIWRAINHTTWRARFGPMAERDGDRMTPSLLRQLALAQDVSGVDYQQAMFDRAALFRRVQGLFERADFLVTPTISRAAPGIGQDLFDPLEIDGVAYPDMRPNWFPWCMPFNLTGHPAISLPCGFTPEGLPLGLQIVGRFREDASLLRAAALFEAASALLDRWPDAAFA